MYCKHCGKPLESDSSFCRNCGKPVSREDALPEGPAGKEPKSRGRKPILTGLIAGLILTAICSPLVLIGRGMVLDSDLNPANRGPGEESSWQPSPELEAADPADPPAAEASQPAAPPVFPDAPMVFASDRGAPNYDQCHPEKSCVLQVFYTPAALTGTPVNLTGPLGFAAASEPVLSPDGTRVAFTGFVEGAAENHIYVVNTDGSGLRVMTLVGFNHGHPSWSPDGNSLVVMSSPTGENSYHLYTIDVESRQASQLTSGTFMDRFPDWAPDGSRIAFHSNRADPNPAACWPNCKTGLFVVDLQSGQIQPLGGEISGGGYAWSPDGTRIAFHASANGSWDIYIREADGAVRQLTSDPGEEVFPSWSPDGLFIAYAGDTPAGKDILVTPADFFDPLNYTASPAFDHYPDW